MLEGVSHERGIAAAAALSTAGGHPHAPAGARGLGDPDPDDDERSSDTATGEDGDDRRYTHWADPLRVDETGAYYDEDGALGDGEEALADGEGSGGGLERRLRRRADLRSMPLAREPFRPRMSGKNGWKLHAELSWVS